MVAVNHKLSMRLSWANGAPTLTGGDPIAAAPGNPGGTGGGQMQVNVNAALTPGLMIVTGTAGPASWKVTPQNGTGLIKIVDDAGAAVNFGATTGFAMLEVYVEATA